MTGVCDQRANDVAVTKRNEMYYCLDSLYSEKRNVSSFSGTSSLNKENSEISKCALGKLKLFE